MGSTRALGSVLRHARFVLVLSLSFVFVLGVAAPVAADEQPPPKTELQRVLDIARGEIGAKYSFASAGPNTFDCSGFVTWVYKEAGLLDRIGGKRRTVQGYFDWFKSRNKDLVNKSDPLPGDLVVWGKNQHIGIYAGDGMAISALLNPYGVKAHRVSGYVPIKLTAYLHVDIER